jgi:membrane fusion protein (multidrug efflux system)
MFVNLRLTTGTLENAIVLPQAAVLRDDTGAYVLSVDPGGQVAQRRVETHGMTQTGWIVTGDLDAGERVIVEGVQKVQPGGKATVTTPEQQPAQEQQPAPADGN